MNYCDGENWRQYNSPGCPPTVEDQDGNTYKTVQIGDQCWMAENLNVGVMVDSVDTGSTHSDVSDNGTIEKYCYDNDPANCETDGGLYDWNEAMQYTTEEGTQGICPAGWHIPTDEEWKTLEMQLGMSQTEADDTGWRGTDEGDKLKVPDKCEGGENCNASLFGGLLAGSRHHEGPFYNRGAFTRTRTSGLPASVALPTLGGATCAEIIPRSTGTRIIRRTDFLFAASRTDPTI
jgi:uncharacterized protein (TIGR02145 family)